MFNPMFDREIRHTLDAFRRSVDQFFSDVYRSSPDRSVGGGEYTFTPAVESFWGENEAVLRAILPGVTEKDVKVTLHNDNILIEGERKAPENLKDNAWTQMAYGKFRAAIPLPNGLDLEKLECRLHDGVLDVRVPVAEQMKPRRIPIGSGETKKAIAA